MECPLIPSAVRTVPGRRGRGLSRGRFDDQIVPVMAPDEASGVRAIDGDEGLRETTPLVGMEPVLAAGIDTAARTAQISDGTSAVVVVYEPRATGLGRSPLARIVDIVTVGVEVITR